MLAGNFHLLLHGVADLTLTVGQAAGSTHLRMTVRGIGAAMPPERIGGAWKGILESLKTHLEESRVGGPW